MQEHVYDQFTQAQEGERRAKEEAQGIVNQLISAADLLRKNWSEVVFEWDEEGGTTLHRAVPPTQNSLREHDFPSFHQLRKAIEKWRDASGRVQAIQDNLTHEQRRTLGLPPR